MIELDLLPTEETVELPLRLYNSDTAVNYMGSSISSLNRSDDILTSAISQDCVVVFSNPTCSFCKKVNQLFKDDDIEFKDVEISSYGARTGELAYKLQSHTGRRTVPQVFINGKFVGGYSDIEGLRQAGKLYDLVKQCSKKGTGKPVN